MHTTFNNVFTTGPEFGNAFDSFFKDADLNSYRYVSSISNSDRGMYRQGESIYGEVRWLNQRYNYGEDQTPGHLTFSIGCGNHGYTVYSFIETIREHIFASMQKQIAHVSVPIYKDSIYQIILTPKETEQNVKPERLNEHRVSKYQKRGISPDLVHQLVLPMLRDFLADCGIQLVDNQNQIELSWTQGTNPNHPLPKELDVAKVPSLNEYLVTAFQTQDLTDMTFKCQDGQVNAHELVLCLASEYFRSLFSSGLQEKMTQVIELPNYSLKTLKSVLDHIYKGNNPFEAENQNEIPDPIDILQIAHQWRLSSLFEHAANVIGRNAKPEEWKEIGNLGATYESKYLLQVYNCYRIRRGEQIDPEILPAMQKFGLAE